MANVFEHANKYANELDRMIVQESKTGFLADGKFKARFTGARTVNMPQIDFDGLGDYDRETGYSKGGTNFNYTAYTLEQERSKQLVIDAQDADESGMSSLTGKVVGEYTRTKVNPEIDAYVLSKLYGVAKEKGNVTAFNSEKAASVMLDCINKAEAASGYTNEQMVAFVDPVMYAALMTSNELQRSITVSDFEQGNADLKVKNLNGCAIIPVAADRMRTKYVFNDAGFAAASDAESIKAIVMPKSAASLVKKVDKVDIFTPDIVQDMDAYKINFRLYYDCFVTENKKGLIFAVSGE
ncbi:MAG: hypothetical protein U0L33_05325 [Acutalibacteraceae bacterium]|nr:hypothetical protein [Acutalibacteraceae bacterium]